MCGIHIREGFLSMTQSITWGCSSNTMKDGSRSRKSYHLPAESVSLGLRRSGIGLALKIVVLFMNDCLVKPSVYDSNVCSAMIFACVLVCVWLYICNACSTCHP